MKTTLFAILLTLLISCVPETEYNSLQNENKELTKVNQKIKNENKELIKVNQQIKNELTDIKAKYYLLSKNKNAKPKSTENTEIVSVEELRKQSIQNLVNNLEASEPKQKGTKTSTNPNDFQYLRNK